MRTLISILTVGILSTTVGCGSSSETTPPPKLDAAATTPPPAADAATFPANAGPEAGTTPLPREDASVPPSGTGLDSGTTTPPPALDARPASDAPSSGRSPSTGAQCPASSGGKTCTGEDEYYDCLLAACGAEYAAYFGPNYASGDFSGSPCAGFIGCEMQCPCDSTASTCETGCVLQYLTADPACSTVVGALFTCVSNNIAPAGKCVQPVCSEGTSTTTSTGTSTSTATSAASSCAAAQACCASLGAGAQQCMAAIADQNETTCATVLSTLQAQGLCPTTTATATSTTTLTATSTATSTVTSTTTPTSTSTSTSTATSTASSCAAARACCAALPVGAQTCLDTLAGQTEAACATILSTLKAQGLCS